MRQLRRRFLQWVFRVTPCQMIQNRNTYLYVDWYGRIWRLTPTCDVSCPFSISLEYDR